MTDRQRLLTERIEARRSQAAAPDEFEERGFVQNAAAGRVDDDRAKREEGELPGADEVLRFRAKRNVKRQNVGRAETFGKVLDERGLKPVISIRVRVENQYSHAKCGGPLRHFAADPATADDQERTSFELDAHYSRARLEIAPADGVIERDASTRSGEDENIVLGDRDCVDVPDD